ncbi:hypothetical protein BKA63DRAFT_570595 [Paraphoma chrysanthemicola]|nr:hypothetical protein BKA63DRAFT_570595 [Paraphoma chrysanthemicola]
MTSTDESVSSIYGPGATICWLCTVLSVILSWTFNRSSWEHDTITNDLVACLLLPAVALVHLIYELAKGEKIENWKATPTMNAAFTICAMFVTIGPALCSLAGVHWHKRRTASTLLLLVACIITVTTILSSSGSKYPTFDKENIALWAMLGWCNIFGIPALLIWHTRSRLQSLNVLFAWIPFMYIICMISIPALSGYLDRDVGDQTSWDNTIRLFPRTPYSLGDIDQAVAAGIGALTLLLCVRDMILEIRTSVDDEFERWKVRCMDDIESGNLEVEIPRWKTALEVIDKKARCKRTRARHRKRERDQWEALPEDLKGAFKILKEKRDERIVASALKKSGFF